MLPFLKKNREASASAPPDSIRREPDDEADSYDSLHSAAEDLLKAVESKNIKGIAEAIRAAFELCESSPHEEGEHI